MKKRFALIIFAALIGGIFWFRNTLFPTWNAQELIITFNTPADDLSAYGLDTNNHTRIANLYEGLVKLDSNLSITPGLATSWGNIDENTWEFRLREGVIFHDGSFFSPQDVLNSFEAAKASGNLQIQPYINSIESIKIKEGGRLEIKTKTPDPLLLSKLSKFYIQKDNYIGTGPYQLKNWSPGTYLELSSFADYWGPQAKFSNAIYEVDVDWVKREQKFEDGKIDILASVPPELASNLSPKELKTGYGLEVFFLMFNLNDPIFSQKELRESVQKLVDPQQLVLIGNGFVRPATQFIAQGVFGYNEKLMGLNHQVDQEPRDLFGIELKRIDLDYPSSLRTLAEYLASQLKKAGFSVNLNANDSESLLNKVKNNDLQLYLVGWHAENGDAGSFYDSFIHSQGAFNQGGYKNETLDRWIEASRSEMEPVKRLEILKNIAAELEKDLIGIPLFETSRTYAVQENVEWEPRLDGLILASEVR